MWKRVWALAAASIAVLGVTACGAGVPRPPADGEMAMVERDRQAFIEAMKPRGQARLTLGTMEAKTRRIPARKR